MRCWSSLLVPMSLGAALAAAGCGGGTSPHVLESITVTPTQTTAQSGGSAFTATGHYSSAPYTVPNMEVSWLVVGPASDPPGAGYALVPGPETAACRAQAAYTVVAYAPQSPSAPSSGPMPAAVYEALVLEHTVASDGGFVAGTAQLNCN